MKKSNFFQIILCLCLLIIAVFFLIWNLDGDPTILRRMGDFPDEGYWVHNAINYTRYSQFLIDDHAQPYFGAPLYNLLLTLQFSLFGISFFNARILSILLLLLTGFTIYLILKEKVKNKTRILIYLASYLAFFDNKIYYQLATPVPLEIFIQSLILLFFIKNKLNVFYKVLLGVFLVCLAILSKTSSVWLILFMSIIIIKDNITLLKFKDISKVVLYISFFLTPLFLINFLFNFFEHEKYIAFKEIIVAQNFKMFHSNIINPSFYIERLQHLLKYNNSFLLFLMPFIFLIITPISRYKPLIKNDKRLFFILVIYLLMFIGFLIFINQLYDRRLINIIVPLFILSILIHERLLEKKIKFKKYQAFLITLFLIYISKRHWYQLTYKIGYHDLYLFKIGSEKYLNLFYVPLLIFIISIVISIFRSHHQHLFLIFIIANLSFHLLFINQNQTLKNTSHDINNYILKNNVKYTTGYLAHHLAIESNIIPIWWTQNLTWNHSYNIFTETQNTLIITSNKEKLNTHYFNLKQIPEKFEITKVDTMYLYLNPYDSTYLDTIILNLCSKIKK